MSFWTFRVTDPSSLLPLYSVRFQGFILGVHSQVSFLLGLARSGFKFHRCHSPAVWTKLLTFSELLFLNLSSSEKAAVMTVLGLWPIQGQLSGFL